MDNESPTLTDIDFKPNHLLSSGDLSSVAQNVCPLVDPQIICPFVGPFFMVKSFQVKPTVPYGVSDQ